MSPRARWLWLALAVLAPTDAVGAQKDAGSLGPSRDGQVSNWLGLASLQLGLPQGEFAENVGYTGGVSLGALRELAPHLLWRGELDYHLYGSERRSYGDAGLLNLLGFGVTTTNMILGAAMGLQLGSPARLTRAVQPYAGALIGFSHFNTTTAASGEWYEERFATTTELADNAVARSVFAGLYIPMRKGGHWDIGVRHTWNGDAVRYLTPRGVREDAYGNLILRPYRTRADLLRISIGFSAPLYRMP